MCRRCNEPTKADPQLPLPFTRWAAFTDDELAAIHNALLQGRPSFVSQASSQDAKHAEAWAKATLTLDTVIAEVRGVRRDRG